MEQAVDMPGQILLQRPGGTDLGMANDSALVDDHQEWVRTDVVLCEDARGLQIGIAQLHHLLDAFCILDIRVSIHAEDGHIWPIESLRNSNQVGHSLDTRGAGPVPKIENDNLSAAITELVQSALKVEEGPVWRSEPNAGSTVAGSL